MSLSKSKPTVSTSYSEYRGDEHGFSQYLMDLGDELFPFPSYREYQDEILYESLQELFVNGKQNVIIEGPTGIGKSPLNVALGRVISHLSANKRSIEEHFGVRLHDIGEGDTFYTTPQKSLRDQLAEDEDLQEYVEMLKSRRDYVCGVSGESCDQCPVKADPETPCYEKSDCTYWSAKARAMQSDIAVLTFAMLIVDYEIPEETDEGVRIGFGNRDAVIVDEGHGLESQAASLFAGFSVSPWAVPEEVYADAGSKVSWNADRFEDVDEILDEIEQRAEKYVEKREGLPNYEQQVESCKNTLRKIRYCREEIKEGRSWVVNVDEVRKPDSDEKTKKIELKPVKVDRFLQKFIWSRGTKRIITSATIPYRDNIERWESRIGLDGETELISKPMPFPAEHRGIYTNTKVGSMSGDSEDENWREVVDKIRTIHQQHRGEKGLIHTASYKRADKLADWLNDSDVVVDDDETDTSVMLQKWQNSDKDIFLSPAATEGVDLYEDRCRWQVLLKTPYAHLGDSRVDYLMDSDTGNGADWNWYNQTALLGLMQSVGRAVRGPEPEEAASYYVIDSSFDNVIKRTSPPDWFLQAITEQPPRHWEESEKAPWR